MRFPKATWAGPIPNERHLGMVNPRAGLVLHIEQGSESSANNWFHNPKAEASAHFGNPKSGSLQQWVDTDDEAWAEKAGNSRWFSVEHEGFSGDALTANQLENDAQLLAWLHTNYKIPLVITDTPGSPGLGWHGMGGDAWGGHLACPGQPIKAARAAIIARAIQILNPPKPKPKIVKAFASIATLVKSPITVAAKRTLSNPAPVIVPHPHGGEALCYVSQNIWQGIPLPADKARLEGVGVKEGGVPAAWWATAKQVAW